MQMIFDFCLSFLDLIDGLYILFFEPLGEVPTALYERFATIDGVLANWLLENFLDNLSSRAPWFAQYSLATIFLGAGVSLFLLWRFIQFIVPLLD